MTVETLYCAVCGERTAPDVDHVEIGTEHEQAGQPGQMGQRPTEAVRDVVDAAKEIHSLPTTFSLFYFACKELGVVELKPFPLC
jgi:hypothetical protein